MDANLRSGGEWRRGEIYVFVLTVEGVSLFQAPDRDREGASSGGAGPAPACKAGQEGEREQQGGTSEAHEPVPVLAPHASSPRSILSEWSASTPPGVSSISLAL